MTTREKLLDRVRQNKPEALPLPSVPTFVNDTDDLLDRFRKALAFVGGQLVELHSGQPSSGADQVNGSAGADTRGEGLLNDLLSVYLRRTFPNAQRIASAVPLLGLERATVAVGSETDKVLLEQIDVAVLSGAFVVAENAAVWLPEDNMLHRALPFIAQHLVLIVNRNTLVPNMHIAYQRIDKQGLTYGTFIAGPSKTADIEQSLVIGAHGARSLTVILTDGPTNI